MLDPLLVCVVEFVSTCDFPVSVPALPNVVSDPVADAVDVSANVFSAASRSILT
jgi:hypothetical protein